MIGGRRGGCVGNLRLPAPIDRLLRGEFVDVGRQTRFVARRRIPVENAFLHRLVDERDRLRQQLLRLLRVTGVERRAQFLDRRA